MAVEKAQVSADDLLPILSFVLVQALTEERPAQTVEAAMSASASSCWLHEHVAIMEEFLLPHMMARRKWIVTSDSAACRASRKK